ncbi:hypothetical protein BYT27DRAFT_7209825 [Phlegmacium glaucopus]|nr:hypothetical protein BYT27DRAFT_7209825 [Phlegmacium glaucopus]
MTLDWCYKQQQRTLQSVKCFHRQQWQYLPPPPRPIQAAKAPPATNQGHREASILEYIFLTLVIVIIVCVIFRRYLRVKHGVSRSSNLPDLNSSVRDYPSASRRYPSFHQPMELQSLECDGQFYPPYPHPPLPGFPAAYMGRTNRRTRATDIDSSGRRLGDITAETDHDGELGIKDFLPAYDNSGGPPKYLESEIQNRNRSPPDVVLENTTHSSLPRNDNGGDDGIDTSVVSSNTDRQAAG